MKFKENDFVKFSLPYAYGIGVVINVDEEHRKYDLYNLNFEWLGEYKNDYEEQEEDVDEGFCDNISESCLTRLTEEEFTDEAKEHYIWQTELNEQKLSAMTEEEKQRIRRFVNELVEKGNFCGYFAKGYLTYGDSPIFKCDWETSRACLEKCVELRCDPRAANSLGYIYYYGRCNNGKADYEKAFRYYSIAALAGVHESIYKVGDLFLNGYGVPKNEDLARTLYERVYDETRPRICYGDFNNNFADAALRMAKIYEREGYDEMEIYRKYLEAGYAICGRTALNYYGDNRVSEIIKEGIAQYAPEKQLTIVHDENVPVLDAFSMKNRSQDILRVTIERKKRHVKFNLQIVDSSKHKNIGRGALLAIPQLSYCGLVKSFSFSCNLDDCDYCSIADGEKEVFYCTDITEYVSELEFEKTDGNKINVESSDWVYRCPTKKDEI